MTGTRRWVALGGAIAAIVALIFIIQLTIDPAPPATVDTTAGGGAGSRSLDQR